ncbi:hypothetical protein PYCCODRAFT_1009165 [Trametes coccinea BRFM310]|uniref:Uncharacterized protein n=1 Tax=Trametes coccinea (strain BRFM310) TaxID=1353009 RepID=A0A1Y2IB75_TRAC3|nr:hypothetical protein PYCCODRAFT_1009165 [Trametes coccinea BRFM310]
MSRLASMEPRDGRQCMAGIACCAASGSSDPASWTGLSYSSHARCVEYNASPTVSSRSADRMVLQTGATCDEDQTPVCPLMSWFKHKSITASQKMPCRTVLNAFTCTSDGTLPGKQRDRVLEIPTRMRSTTR